MIGDASIPSSNIDATRNASAAPDVISIVGLGSDGESDVPEATPAENDAAVAAAPLARKASSSSRTSSSASTAVPRSSPASRCACGRVGHGAGRRVGLRQERHLVRAARAALARTLGALGRIQWNGADLAHADEKTLQRVRGHEIAFISQEPTRALDPMFTVGWQLAAAIKRLRGVSGPRPSASRPSCSTTSASSTRRGC